MQLDDIDWRAGELLVRGKGQRHDRLPIPPIHPAMRHNPDFGTMPQLMQGRAMPVDRLEISPGRRHLHVVGSGHVEGPVAADTEIDARCLDQRLDPGFDQAGLRRRHGDREVLRHAFALREIEDGEAFEERNGLRFVAGLPGAPLLVVGNEAVGVDDRRAALTLADVAAEAERLAEGDPSLSRKAVLDDGALRISTLIPE
jgi:hypothetical protein